MKTAATILLALFLAACTHAPVPCTTDTDCMIRNPQIEPY